MTPVFFLAVQSAVFGCTLRGAMAPSRRKRKAEAVADAAAEKREKQEKQADGVDGVEEIVIEHW